MRLQIYNFLLFHNPKKNVTLQTDNYNAKIVIFDSSFSRFMDLSYLYINI